MTMAQNELILKDDTPTSYTYNLVSLANNEAVYRESGSTLGNPDTLRISHQLAKSADGVDRHLVALNVTRDDADGVPYTGGVHVVVTLPREGVALADLETEREKLQNLLDVAFTELCGGFFPSAGSA